MDKFLSYGKQYIDKNDIEAVISVLKSDYLTQGPKIEEFEKAICEYTGARYCIAVSNGTAALHLAVKVLNIEEGNEGITSPNTFVASANCLVYNRLKPVFADIDEITYNIDPIEVGRKLTNKTKVIVPVHFAGQPVNIEKINEIAKDKNAYIIEDASHAIGSCYANGSRVGNCRYSDMTTFSFHPVKTLTTGEGGVITTNNLELYERLKILRTHGVSKCNMSQNPGPWYYEMQDLGFNYRLTDIQAALGISQLKKLEGFIKRRREIVEKYNKAFKNIEWLTIPHEGEKVFSAFHLYVLKINFEKIGKSRKEIMEELREKSIGTQVHYIPIHTQPYYMSNYGYKFGNYPKAENYYSKTLTIPLFPDLRKKEIDYIVNSIILLAK